MISCGDRALAAAESAEQRAGAADNSRELAARWGPEPGKEQWKQWKQWKQRKQRKQ
jgi:hypothetical protein